MQFDIKILNPHQELGLLTLEARTEHDAAHQAQVQGNIVISVSPHRSRVLNSGFLAHKNDFPLVLFSQELLSLLDAGLSLMESIETLYDKEHRPAAKQVLSQIMQSLKEGLSLSQALETAEGVFPPLYIALIKSSQETGNTIEALTRYIDYQLQADHVRKKMISASIYPAILIVVGTLVIMFLMLYVVPKFSALYEGAQSNLPWMSQWLLSWGQLLHAHGTTIVILLASLILLFGYALSRPVVRQHILKILWNIPSLGNRMRIYQLARFYRTLGMLLRGGIPAVTAMSMVAGLLQPELRQQLQLAITDIREGQALSTVMENRELSTPVAVRMLRVGERSGQMGEMMERISHFYDDEIARWVDWFTRLFEPILMTGIGVIVGVIVVLMYMPIFELAGSVQ